MKNWLEDLNKTLGLGLILAFIVFLIRGYYGILGEISFWAFLFRWIHVVFGILWIGLLYYFNFVQIPSMPKVPDEQKPAITKVIAPAALFYFRWAAAGTVLFGLLTAGANGYLGHALCCSRPSSPSASACGSPLSWPPTSGLSSGRTRRRCWASSTPTPKRRRRRDALPYSRRAPTPCCRFPCSSAWSARSCSRPKPIRRVLLPRTPPRTGLSNVLPLRPTAAVEESKAQPRRRTSASGQS